MPNGTLCGKAVVEMLLGEESGAPIEYVEEKLVRTGNLPQAYVITKDRMERCKALASVSLQFGESQAKAKKMQERPATNPQAEGQHHNHALQEYQMQLMLLEQQRKKRAKTIQERPATNPQAEGQHYNHALQEYQMQLMLLEQQRKKRLLMERMCELDESDSKHQGESTSEPGRNIALPHQGGHPAP